ncbi:zinc-binding dehydrogenase [Tetragenococcus halophilus]|uniref:zinc-binding dehydrogenase n=1 Tax=Tetragenococcus halophilus TaxID=51669 RepID=UPI0036F37526
MASIIKIAIRSNYLLITYSYCCRHVFLKVLSWGKINQCVPHTDLLISCCSGKELKAFRRKLKPDGKLLTIAFDVKKPIKGIFSVLFSTQYGQHRTRLLIAFPIRKNLTHLTQLVNNGDIVSAVNSTYSMEQVIEAH